MGNAAETITIPLSEYNSLKNEVAELTRKTEWFMEQLRLAKHRQFGASSEKSIYDGEQLSIFNEAEAAADTNVLEPELVEVEKHFRKRRRLVNDRLPENLPVETVEHELPADEQICPECGGGLHVISNEKRRELVVIPAQIKIREHIRKIYGCRECEKDECGYPIIKTPVDNPVIK